MSELTKRQEAFVRAYMGEAKGIAYEAAKIAGYKGNRNSLDATASRMLRNIKIVKRITELSEEEKKIAIVDRTRRRELLSLMAEDENRRDADRLKAIELLGKMGGDFIERRQVDVTQRQAKEEQTKSQEFIANVSPERLKELLDKTYGDESTVN